MQDVGIWGKINSAKTGYRRLSDLYPDYSAELAAIKAGGITTELLRRIIDKHSGNATHTKELSDRYQIMEGALPISNREPRFDEGTDTVNNQLNNDFFGEITDFKTGYFAGKAIAYSYSDAEEIRNEPTTEGNIDEAKKALSDFVTRNNMYDIDMETTKLASICGYCGRLFYIGTDGNERVQVTPPYETILLFHSEMTEPDYGVRYFWTSDINDCRVLHAEFYDDRSMIFYKGSGTSDLRQIEKKPHLFDFCPLQGIPNNHEQMGDAEKVISLIDDYDKVISDNSNELESFAHAYMEFKNVIADDDMMDKAKKAGSFSYRSVAETDARIGFITKEVNDAYNEHHLERLRKGIYKFSKTPDLSDESFGTASGISLKFKLTGLETKCGMFQAKLQTAGVYMFKLLCSSWRKKQIKIDPLQCFMNFKRNFPLDILSEAQAVQALRGAGLPQQVALENLSFIDDIDYVMQLIEDEKDSIPPLVEATVNV